MRRGGQAVRRLIPTLRRNPLAGSPGPDAPRLLRPLLGTVEYSQNFDAVVTYPTDRYERRSANDQLMRARPATGAAHERMVSQLPDLPLNFFIDTSGC